MAALTRTVDDVLGVSDAPVKKTSTGVGTDTPVWFDSEANFVTSAPVNDNLGLTDTILVIKAPSPGGDNPLNLSDTGSTYHKGLSGDDLRGMSDVVLISTTSTVTWQVTITDELDWEDLDAGEFEGWFAQPNDVRGMTDLVTAVKAGGTTASIENVNAAGDLVNIKWTQVLPDDTGGWTDEAPVVTQTAGAFVTRTIEDPTGFIDDDGAGDTSNFLTVIFVLGGGGNTIGQPAEDELGFTDSLVVTTQDARKIFTGPVVLEAPPNDEIWWYKQQVGVTLIQHLDDSWSQVRFPVDSDLQGQQRVFRGGYEYVLSDADAAALTAGGFGDGIRQAEPVVVTESGDAGIPTTGFGYIPYGSGPYGG